MLKYQETRVPSPSLKSFDILISIELFLRFYDDIRARPLPLSWARGA